MLQHDDGVFFFFHIPICLTKKFTHFRSNYNQKHLSKLDLHQTGDLKVAMKKWPIFILNHIKWGSWASFINLSVKVCMNVFMGQTK